MKRRLISSHHPHKLESSTLASEDNAGEDQLVEKGLSNLPKGKQQRWQPC